MKPAYRPILVVFVVFAAVMIVVGVSRLLAAKELIPWRADFAAARLEAQRAGKPLLVYFTADWCAPCHQLKSTTWADERVDAALRAYVPVRIDVDRNPAIANEYNVRALPAYIVVDAEKTARNSADGYLGPEDFLAWLRK